MAIGQPTGGRRRSYTIDAETRRLADEMKNARETMQTILRETIESAEGPGPPLESGRTACGSAKNLRAPLARYPRAVDLSSCPREKAGLWHTHPSRGQFSRPSLSLPDMALVAYDGVDVHMVVGTESAEMLIAPVEREQFRDEFSNAVGAGVTSTADIIRAAGTGKINPERARERVRGTFSQLVESVPTGFHNLSGGAAVASLPASEPLRACTHAHHHTSGPDAGRLRQRSRSCADGVRSAANGSGINIQELVVSQTVGTVIGGIANEFILQRWLGVG